MSECDELLASIANTIADYREGELARPDAEHVKRWIKQFDEPVRMAMLQEMDHVLKKTYFTKIGTRTFLSGLFKTKKLVGDDPLRWAPDFGQGVKLVSS